MRQCQQCHESIEIKRGPRSKFCFRCGKELNRERSRERMRGIRASSTKGGVRIVRLHPDGYPNYLLAWYSETSFNTSDGGWREATKLVPSDLI